MKNILVATDLSKRSDRARDRAALLARQLRATLHIVYVVDDATTSTVALAIEEAATTELQKQVDEGASFKGVKTAIYIEFGHPWKIIADLAERHEADLIVLGTHRNLGFRELFNGTTLHRLAKVSKAPLLVAAEPADHGYRNIIVGVDFSECARHATDLASRIADGYPLTLVHAYHIPFKHLTRRADQYGHVDGREKKRVEAEIRRHMGDFFKSLKNPHKDTAVVIREGGSVAVLQAEVTGRQADLVCVGSHGKPWLVDAVLGSTAYDLLAFPPCDILVAPLRHSRRMR